MIDLTPEDLIQKIERLEARLNAHQQALVKERQKATELLMMKYEIGDTVEMLREVLESLKTNTRMSAQIWSGLDPV
jgi:hypothetical protein